MSIREKIDSRLREIGWTRYKLAKAMRPHLSMQSVYQYLSGQSDTSVSKLQIMLDLLGLDLTTGTSRIVQTPCTGQEKAKKSRKTTGKAPKQRKD